MTAGREGDEALAATAYVPEDVNAKNLGDVNSHGEDERGAGTRACMADGETMAAEEGDGCDGNGTWQQGGCLERRGGGKCAGDGKGIERPESGAYVERPVVARGERGFKHVFTSIGVGPYGDAACIGVGIIQQGQYLCGPGVRRPPS